MTERTLKKDEKAYKMMEIVAKALEIESPNNATYRVEDVYLDFGQDWMWTTICRYGYRECQVLNPREWQEICLAEISDIARIVEDIRSDKYFGDK